MEARASPEAQSADIFQIVLGGDLAGGVADKGHRDILGVDAAAVVGHLDALHPSPLDGYGHLGRAGVDGVFQQFLYHRGGTLHHLPAAMSSAVC